MNFNDTFNHKKIILLYLIKINKLFYKISILPLKIFLKVLINFGDPFEIDDRLV